MWIDPLLSAATPQRPVFRTCCDSGWLAGWQVRRYVMEDRFCAIRAAIGTAQARDVVIIAGKGAQDFQEYGDGEGGVIKVCSVGNAMIGSNEVRT